MRHAPPPARESGQAAVEAALVIPMMVFMVLGIIQLGMMHHARLMTEYAAYRAARAGIVNHGHCIMMRDSAIVALLPTMGPPPNFNPVGAMGRTDTLLNALKLYKSYTLPGLNANLYYLPNLPMVRVHVLNPRKSQIGNLFSQYGSHMGSSEIDFDDVRDNQVIEANLLSVRVTYLYNMRIPFANKLIHSWAMGLDLLKYNLGEGVQFENQTIGGQNEFDVLEGRGAMRGGDYTLIAGLAKARGLYVLPIVATYNMRMQSNLMKKHIQGCAVNG